MMENDDKLLEDFFASRRQEIADNGFTGRVMRSLPDHSERLARIWTAVCFVLAAVLFVVFDGIELLENTLRETLAGVLENASQIDPGSLVIAGMVLLYFMYRKIASLA